jgi:hypothetical protein
MGRHHHGSIRHGHHGAAPGPVAARRGSALGTGARSALLGLAAGGRSSLALAAPALRDPARGRVARTAARLGVLGELVTDKLPSTPSRVTVPALGGRVVAAALGGATLARQRGRGPLVPAATAAAFSVAGSVGGVAWRTWAGRRGPDWPAALAEDAVVVLLAGLATRR